ncbi:MAG: repeat-containing protein, partial [Clostridia bacterium]|nr:repeat-containing protein [Clostridia bacterium]
MWNETNNLHFINKFLPPGASILCIEEPNRRSAVVSADFDGDDIHEIAAAYRWNNRNGIVILKWFDGYWYPISYIKGSGYGITYFNAVPITGKPTYDLVIGWQHGAIYSQLDIQEWSENGFTSLLGNDVYYSEIEVANIPTKDEIDRKYEIALWSHDTGNAYVIEVYQWDGKSLKPFPQAYPYYFKKVADYYKKQVARLPDAAFYWYYLADAQFKTEQYHDALKSIETAINLRADYPSYSALLQLKELILSNLRKDLFLYPAALRTVDGTKWGYINSYGVFVIKPQYDNAMGFQNNGLAIIEKDGLSGVIDRNGRFRVPLKYYSINPFIEGRATVIDDSGFHVIDENGKIMTSKAYSYIGGYQNGRAVFYNVDNQESTLYGYLDKQGKEVIHAQYKSANDFADNQALVMIQDNQFALIGLNGEKLHSYQFAFVNNPGNGLLPFQPDANSKYGYINIDGNIILQPKYSMALPFKDQRAIVNTSDDFNNQFGLIDKQGNFVLSPIYNDINPIGENRVAVGKAIDPEQPYIGSIYAIADMASGNILTPFSYSNVLTYNKGYVSVSDGSKTFF